MELSRPTGYTRLQGVNSRPTPRGSPSPVRENHERRCTRPTDRRRAGALYDVNVPTPAHAERARTLVAQISTGTLCTLAHDPEGYPYGSFVTVAFDRGNPIFLISGLAEHTKNLERILARRCSWPRAPLQIRSPTAASRCSDRASPAGITPRDNAQTSGVAPRRCRSSTRDQAVGGL